MEGAHGLGARARDVSAELLKERERDARSWRRVEAFLTRVCERLFSIARDARALFEVLVS